MLKAIFITLGIYTATLLICFGLANAQFKYKFKRFKGMDLFWKEKEKTNTTIEALSAGAELFFKINNQDLPLRENNTSESDNGEDIENTENINNIIEIEDDYVIDGFPLGMAISCPDFKTNRAKLNLKVSDLSAKIDMKDMTKSIYQKSHLYLGNFALMSVFYSIAVMQIAFRSAKSQEKTGSQNICYFNALCQKPLGPFLDFNHFYSNFGYVVSGITFVSFVHLRKYRYKKMMEGEAFVENKFGIPHQHGIYYTMGGALIMEGLLSAAFHVCPSQLAFQFDTTYMYLIAILIYVKLYQNRHSDVTSNSVQIYLLLGLALVLEATSIYYNTPAFWTVFCLAYIFGLSILVLNMYNIGAVRSDKLLIVHVAKMFFLELSHLKSKFHGKRNMSFRPNFIYLTIKTVLNVSLCVYFAYKASEGEKGVSNYFLLIFMANMFAYTLYYLTMKVVSGERLTFTNCLYGFFSTIFFVPSMYFFLQRATLSEESPAESRDVNNGCIFLDYFDQHDIWHFMSAAGLFFGFMFVLTIDEGLEYTKRSDIRVF